MHTEPRPLLIADDLSLPLSFVTARVALVGTSGGGKSNGLARCFEQTVQARARAVLLDRLGASWGLRTSADGKSPGLPVPILGGHHADVDIGANDGARVAHELDKLDASAVIDFSAFDGDDAVIFAADFCEELLRIHRRTRKALALFVDEAQMFAPQTPSSAAEHRCGTVLWHVHTGGRAAGIGLKTATQSAAEQNKRTMKQAELFIALRTFSPLDQKPILDYLRTSVDKKQAAEIQSTLSRLKTGTAWFISPQWLGIVEKHAFKLRDTFDSSRTPEVGEKIISPTVTADVDIARLRKAFAAKAGGAAPADDHATGARVGEMQVELGKLKDENARLRNRGTFFREQYITLRNAVVNALDAAQHPDLSDAEPFAALQPAAPTPEQVDAIRNAPSGHFEDHRAPQTILSDRVEARMNATGEREVVREVVTGGQPLKLPSGALRMVEALARNRGTLTKKQLGTLSKVSSKSGTFSDYLSKLRTVGYITSDSTTVTLTPEGAYHCGVSIRVNPPTTEEVVALYRPELPAGAKRMLDLIVVHKSLLKSVLADLSGVSPKSGTFADYLSILRRNGLIENVGSRTVRATSVLFPKG